MCPLSPEATTTWNNVRNWPRTYFDFQLAELARVLGFSPMGRKIHPFPRAARILALCAFATAAALDDHYGSHRGQPWGHATKKNGSCNFATTVHKTQFDPVTFAVALKHTVLYSMYYLFNLSKEIKCHMSELTVSISAFKEPICVLIMFFFQNWYRCADTSMQVSYFWSTKNLLDKYVFD